MWLPQTCHHLKELKRSLWPWEQRWEPRSAQTHRFFCVIFSEAQPAYRNECCSLRNLATSSSHRALFSSLGKHRRLQHCLRLNQSGTDFTWSWVLLLGRDQQRAWGLVATQPQQTRAESPLSETIGISAFISIALLHSQPHNSSYLW